MQSVLENTGNVQYSIRVLSSLFNISDKWPLTYPWGSSIMNSSLYVGRALLPLLCSIGMFFLYWSNISTPVISTLWFLFCPLESHRISCLSLKCLLFKYLRKILMYFVAACFHQVKYYQFSWHWETILWKVVDQFLLVQSLVRSIWKCFKTRPTVNYEKPWLSSGFQL